MELTTTESDLVGSEPGRVFTRSQLLDLVLGFDHDSLERTIDVQVRNIRRSWAKLPAGRGMWRRSSGWDTGRPADRGAGRTARAARLVGPISQPPAMP